MKIFKYLAKILLQTLQKKNSFEFDFFYKITKKFKNFFKALNRFLHCYTLLEPLKTSFIDIQGILEKFKNDKKIQKIEKILTYFFCRSLDIIKEEFGVYNSRLKEFYNLKNISNFGRLIAKLEHDTFEVVSNSREMEIEIDFLRIEEKKFYKEKKFIYLIEDMTLKLKKEEFKLGDGEKQRCQICKNFVNFLSLNSHSKHCLEVSFINLKENILNKKINENVKNSKKMRRQLILEIENQKDALKKLKEVRPGRKFREDNTQKIYSKSPEIKSNSDKKYKKSFTMGSVFNKIPISKKSKIDVIEEVEEFEKGKEDDDYDGNKGVEFKKKIEKENFGDLSFDGKDREESDDDSFEVKKDGGSSFQKFLSKIFFDFLGSEGEENDDDEQVFKLGNGHVRHKSSFMDFFLNKRKSYLKNTHKFFRKNSEFEYYDLERLKENEGKKN